MNLDADFFRGTEAARKKLESLRWENGPVCSHCGATGTAGKIHVGRENQRRDGLYHCGNCRRQFTVTIGTVFQSTHIPLHKWLQAIHLLFSAKKPVGIKSVELALDITYKTAWIMTQRLRTAERAGRSMPSRSLGNENRTTTD